MYLCRFEEQHTLALCPDASSLSETTECPEPLCPSQVLLVRVGLPCPIRGRYPSFFALTDSCARPPSSYLLGSRLVWQVFAGCRQSLLDGGPSRRYLCKSFLGCLAPYLGVSSGASARFFPEDFGLPHAMTGSALSQLPVQRLPHGAISRGCRHSFMFRPPSLLATQVAPTDTILPYGRRGVYFRTSVSSLPPSPSDMLTVRIGQLTAGDFHPIRLTALSAVPIAKCVPSDGLRGIIGKALLIKRFSMKKFHGKYKGTGDASKYRRKHVISAFRLYSCTQKAPCSPWRSPLMIPFNILGSEYY